jgi:hypothetical protein
MNNNVERKFTEKVLANFLVTALEIGNRDEKNHKHCSQDSQPLVLNMDLPKIKQES